jgi:signal peptidase I
MEKSTSHKIAIWLLDLLVNVAIIGILVIVIQKWIIAPFDVSGSSMCDTMNFIDGKCEQGSGEKIIVNKVPYLFGEPKRGEIIVFELDNEDGDKYFIKRIIGLPGDKIRLSNGEVYLTVSGSDEEEKLNETYLNETNFGNTNPIFPEMNEFNVPEGKYFALGDNRAVSTDSRSCFSIPECTLNPENAFVPREVIQGKAWLVWWPLHNIRVVKN